MKTSKTDLSARLEQIKKRNANKTCFDCGEKGTTYAAMNFGTFVCSRCAGLLRELNFKVKGTGVSIFTEKEIDLLDTVGNENASKIWLAKWDDERDKMPNPKDSDEVKRHLIDKYKDKKYYKKETHNYKAYSYCGTVCKNYLMFKSTQYAKKKMRNTSYDEIFEEICDSAKYSTEEINYTEVVEKLVTDIADEIERMTSNAELHLLNENEIKVGNALVDLLRNWEEVLPDGGSNKLQKSSVLYFLREETMMTTKEVRDNMKKYKCVYKLLKKMVTE